MKETLALAKFISELQYDTLPDNVKNMALRLFYDFVGNSSYATKTKTAQIITDYCVHQGAAGKCFVFPKFDSKVETSFAALANGLLGHGFELDDVYMGTCIHPSGPVVAAALAAAQERHASGKQLLTGIIAGYETAIRVGLPVGSGHQDWGYHATASFPVFGATAAVASIIGLDQMQTACALGIAGSLASGVKQFAVSVSPSMVEAIHGGKAAQQGIMCAMLAEKGFTGPIDILEGSFGYLKVYRGTRKVEDIEYHKITDDLGKKYYALDISIKPNCNCATTLTICEAIADFKKDVRFDASKIDKVIIRTNHCVINAHMNYAPNSVSAAQYSTPFSVALNLLYDVTDPSPFLNEKLNEDKAVLALAQKIKAELDPAVDALFPDHYANKIEVYLNDGTVFKGGYVDYKGSAENPYSDEQLITKFKNLVAKVYPEDVAKKLEAHIASTVAFDDVNNIFAGL